MIRIMTTIVVRVIMIIIIIINNNNSNNNNNSSNNNNNSNKTYIYIQYRFPEGGVFKGSRGTGNPVGFVSES